jgi:glycerol-3-phosphate O-acyltransferase / dihydroxyacetone phosphate acyltransferase
MTWRANPVVRWFASAVCWVFYRIDRAGGEVPCEGPILLLPNHPNSLLDPAIVWATAGRDVRFLAKSTLFEGAFRPVLVVSGAIPVYRKLDQGVDTSRNTETFAAVSAALAAGDAVCLFPEGISHSTGRLEPLRTGAARMALAAEREGTGVALIPVGLNFDRKTTFRSRGTVVFGRPFSARDLLPASDDAYPAAVRALTDRIADHMRQLLVEADPLADAALIERVDRLYAAARARPSNPEERLARRQTIAAGMERLRTVAPHRYHEILLKLRRYDQRLKRFGLRDRHLDWQVSTKDALTFAIRELAIGVVLLPLCAIGLLTFFVPYWLTGFAARQFTREKDVLATAQVFIGAAVYAAWLAIAGVIAWWLRGPIAAVLTVLLLPLLAVASLFAIERESAVVDAVRAWRLLGRARDETRERLRRHRSDLADVLDEVNQWLNDPTGVRS